MTGSEIGPAASLAVFSHPNHELAIFGLLQRWRPALLYLTDGGGADRVAQTREGLRSIGLVDRASFLDHAESSFYEAMLDRDDGFFRSVAQEIAAVIERVQPDRVLCDAVEYYNPVHDVSLPLVLRALAEPGLAHRGITVFEVPLIREVVSDGRRTYAVQRPLGSRKASSAEFTLTAAEVAAKRGARDGIYTLLADQIGPLLADLPDTHLGLETLVPAGPPQRKAVDAVLRYERRARLLLEQGLIERPITYADHFLPLAASLAGGRPEATQGASTRRL